MHEEKASTERKYTKNPKLVGKINEMISEAKKIYHVMVDCKVTIEEDEYIGSIKEQLVEVTYEWCQGSTFGQVCKQVEAYEGTIIRTLRRLHELLKQMSNGAKIIGNDELVGKFEEATTKVFRGMVQAASLYTVG